MKAPVAPRGNRSARGMLTILAMFALGGAVLWGLFLAKRPASPPSPDVPWGVPARTLRVAALDCGWVAGGPPGIVPEEVVRNLREFDPDFVLLPRVRSEDAIAFADGLGMQQSFYPRLFQALGPRPRGPVGCLILSKHPLYDAEPLRREGQEPGCYGVRATAVVDGVRFRVEIMKGEGERTHAPTSQTTELAAVLRVDGPENLHLRMGRAWDVGASDAIVVRGVARGLRATLVPPEYTEHERQAQGLER